MTRWEPANIAALRNALREVRGTVFRAKQLAATPGRRGEAQLWLGDALNRIDRALEASEATEEAAAKGTPT